MSTHRDGAHPLRVEFQGRTLYCCNRCRFSRAAQALDRGRARTVTCPDRCGMTMALHRDRAHPVRVRLQGHTLYCCNWCSFSKSAQRLALRR